MSLLGNRLKFGEVAVLSAFFEEITEKLSNSSKSSRFHYGSSYSCAQ